MCIQFRIMRLGGVYRPGTRHLAVPGAVTASRTCQPAVPGPVPGPVTHLEAVTPSGTHQAAVPGPIPRPVTCLEAVTTTGTRQPGVLGPVTCLEAVTATWTYQPDVPGPVPGPVICLMAATSRGILLLMVPITVPRPVIFLEAVPFPGTHHPAVPGPVPRPVARLATFLTSQTLRTPSPDLGPGPVIHQSLMIVSRMYCLPTQAQATAASSGESSAARYSSARGYSSKWSTEEVGAVASSRPSSSGSAPVTSVSMSPLRPVAAATSTRTSHHGHSPPVAPSHCCSCSLSPVYGGCPSSPRARFRSVRTTSVASLGGWGVGVV